MSTNVFQARAVPVVRKVKCTNVQRNAKMQNEQAWILLGVIGRFYFSFLLVFSSPLIITNLSLSNSGTFIVVI
jgi:hypothetical protein